MTQRKGFTTYQHIRRAMRANEVAVLQYLRKQGGLAYTSLLGKSWLAAFERLQAARHIVYSHRYNLYVVVKGAGPVTPAVRTK